jgi:uncharacterized protein
MDVPGLPSSRESAAPSSLPSRLILDQTLGRLARWLRFLGYDVIWDRSSDPGRLLAQAEEEGRVLLTRDTLLPLRRVVRLGQVRLILVPDDLLMDQLRQLRMEEGLCRQAEPRCLVCNSLLQYRCVDEIRDRIPPYVALTQRRFGSCPRCDRVTWPATHWENMERLLLEAELVPHGAADGTERREGES